MKDTPTARQYGSTAVRFERGEHGMLGYMVNLIDEDDGTVLVTSRDFPELTTFGADRAAALAHAVGALEEAIASRIHARMDVPPPTPAAGDCVYLATLTVAKVMLYRGMRDAQVSKSELARRLNWHFPQVERALDLNHRSRLDQIDAALAAVGLRLDVVGVAETDSPAAVATGGAETPCV